MVVGAVRSTGAWGDLVVRRRVLQLVGESVDHDRSAGVPVIPVRPFHVGLVRIGDLDREKIIAAGIPAREKVPSLGSAQIAGALLLPDRIHSKGDLVRPHHRVSVEEDETPLGLMYYEAIDGRQALRRAQRNALRLRKGITVGGEGCAGERQGSESSLQRGHHLSSKQALAMQ